MGRTVDCELLVGTGEIAALLRVRRPQVVHDWMRRHEDFPTPVALVGQIRVWYWPDVEAWAEATDRI